DLVDHDVVRTARSARPESPSRSVHAEAPALAHDLDSLDDLALGPARHSGCEERHVVSACDEGTCNLLGEDLGATGRGVREVLPVEDQNAHVTALAAGSARAPIPVRRR